MYLGDLKADLLLMLSCGCVYLQSHTTDGGKSPVPVRPKVCHTRLKRAFIKGSAQREN